jgi:hypothetical protein
LHVRETSLDLLFDHRDFRMLLPTLDLVVEVGFAPEPAPESGVVAG